MVSKGVSRATSAVLLSIVIASAAVRISLDDVAAFSPADETFGANVAASLAGGFLAKYPAHAQRYLDFPEDWKYPTPLRWGYFALAAGACSVAPRCTPGPLATLSTLAAIAAVPLTFAVALAFVAPEAALLAAALVASSPLQLALGRRALQDAPATAALLLAVWAFLRMLSATRRRAAWTAAAVLAAAFALSVKEASILYAPALALVWWSRRGRGARWSDLAVLLAPALFVLGYELVARGSFLAMARVALDGVAQPYAQRFQGGPPHRYLFDLLAISPLPVLAAAGAGGLLLDSRDDRGALELALATAAVFGAFAFATRNLRLFGGGDVLVRMLAAWLVARLSRRSLYPVAWIAGAALVFVAADAACFHKVFLEGSVYDPTTFDLLRALGAVPG